MTRDDRDLLLFALAAFLLGLGCGLLLAGKGDGDGLRFQWEYHSGPAEPVGGE